MLKVPANTMEAYYFYYSKNRFLKTSLNPEAQQNTNSTYLNAKNN